MPLLTVDSKNLCDWKEISGKDYMKAQEFMRILKFYGVLRSLWRERDSAKVRISIRDLWEIVKDCKRIHLKDASKRTMRVGWHLTNFWALGEFFGRSSWTLALHAFLCPRHYWRRLIDTESVFCKICALKFRCFTTANSQRVWRFLQCAKRTVKWVKSRLCIKLLLTFFSFSLRNDARNEFSLSWVAQHKSGPSRAKSKHLFLIANYSKEIIKNSFDEAIGKRMRRKARGERWQNDDI